MHAGDTASQSLVTGWGGSKTPGPALPIYRSIPAQLFWR